MYFYGGRREQTLVECLCVPGTVLGTLIFTPSPCERGFIYILKMRNGVRERERYNLSKAEQEAIGKN